MIRNLRLVKVAHLAGPANSCNSRPTFVDGCTLLLGDTLELDAKLAGHRHQRLCHCVRLVHQLREPLPLQGYRGSYKLGS